MARLTLIAAGLLASAIYVARPMIIHPTQRSLHRRVRDTASSPPSGDRRRLGHRHSGHTIAHPAHPATAGRCLAVWPHESDGGLSIASWTGGWRQLAGDVNCVRGGHEQRRGGHRLDSHARLPAHQRRLDRNRASVPARTGPSGLVAGELEWDGERAARGAAHLQHLLAAARGARISRLNANGSWSPLERLSGDDPVCPGAGELGHLRKHRGGGHSHRRP